MDERIAQNRWMPPSPHREAVLQSIEQGRAHIEDRGHGVPALLIFEDGGAMELPKVRYMETHRGMQFVAVEDDAIAEGTKHPDVCGSIDELKKRLAEEPDIAATDPDRLTGLLDHVHAMLSRMQRRREAYEEFDREMAELNRRLAGIEGPDPGPALEQLDAIRHLLRDAPEQTDEIFDLAEAVRDVASRLEKCLYAHRDTAIRIGALYDHIKGRRQWQPKPESDD